MELFMISPVKLIIRYCFTPFSSAATSADMVVFDAEQPLCPAVADEKELLRYFGLKMEYIYS
ncbi:hypothetical protein A0256_01135 [Mucilaginibacter sp. PAMC 26640]|nr:hypothetical protein A0256_01135 [Mucilaginibacter sp. PAMC 26640]